MIPAYIQIHDQIKAEIDQKIWKIGQRLPSERDLAEKFQVMTIPTMILFKDGQAGKPLVAAQSKGQIEQWLKEQGM